MARRWPSEAAWPGSRVHLAVEHPRLWSPDDPYLYDLTVTLLRDGRVIDRAESYAALREIATGATPTVSNA